MLSLFIYLLMLTHVSLVLSRADKASSTQSPLPEPNSHKNQINMVGHVNLLALALGSVSSLLLHLLRGFSIYSCECLLPWLGAPVVGELVQFCILEPLPVGV